MSNYMPDLQLIAHFKCVSSKFHGPSVVSLPRQMKKNREWEGRKSQVLVVSCGRNQGSAVVTRYCFKALSHQRF